LTGSQHDTFFGEELLAPRQTPRWRATPCRLSTTAYSIYSQPPSILKAVPPSATWGCTMPWWQGPTHHGSLMHRNRKYKVRDACYVSWPPVATAHDHKELTRALNSSGSYRLLYLEFSFVHHILPLSSNCAEDDFRSK